MNHVVIIGFMGSGKTRVGKQLSKDLGLSFVDLERLITRKMNMSAREIFQRFGDRITVHWRQWHSNSLSRTVSAGLFLWEQGFRCRSRMRNIWKKSVRSFISKVHWQLLRSVWKAPARIRCWVEMDRDEKIKKLLKQRDPVYEKFADITVVTGEKPFEELIKEIEEKLAAQ